MRTETPTIVRLSTSDVAPVDRLSYWSSAVSSNLTPSAVDRADPIGFESEIAALPLGHVTFTWARGSAQRSMRARPELRRTTEHGFNLVLVLGGKWQVAAGGAPGRFGPGDLIFYDTRDPLSCELLHTWSDINLQLSEDFVRKWLPNPAWLIGRRISRDSQWGRVLSSYVSQLSPEFVVQAPLPHSVLIDQVGALLALVATELRGGRAACTPVERSVRDQIYDYIKQRCTETSLQTADIASSLGISKRTVHRALAACGETFGAMLINARADVAVRMLQSPLLDNVSTAEIGRRAGFSDASHFTKVIRGRTGQTPLRIRRARQI
jgi:AraC family transcriptional regulator, positive regulator of tynA and feaB